MWKYAISAVLKSNRNNRNQKKNVNDQIKKMDVDGSSSILN